MKVCYGLVGMTRGHASRAIAVGKALEHAGHEVKFFTQLDAQSLLEEAFGEDKVVATEMPQYAFSSSGEINPVGTLLKNSSFLVKRKMKAKRVTEIAREWGADLTLSDFEPLMWQVSKNLNLPHITINSQGFLISSKLPKKLPFFCYLQAKVLGALLFAFSPSATLRLVSKVFAKPRASTRAFTYITPIIRPLIQQATWYSQGTHFTVYLKTSQTGSLKQIQSIAEQEGRVGQVFGLTEEMLAKYSMLHACTISEQAFTSSLLNADFVIASPGSQILAECQHLGIPILMVPEEKQFEQRINVEMARESAPEHFQLLQQFSGFKQLAGSKKAESPSHGGQEAVQHMMKVL